MIACTDPLDDDELGNSLPGPPFEMVDCPCCNGTGVSHISLHPLYAGAEPCTDCYAQGELLRESQGDPA